MEFKDIELKTEIKYFVDEVKNILREKHSNIISSNYNISNIISLHEPKQGSNDTYIIVTDNNKYVLKKNQREDFLKIQNLINKNLSCKEVKINKIIPTSNNKLITKEKYALYEYLGGNVYNLLTDEQIDKAIEYIAIFNRCLKSIKLDDIKLLYLNVWDKARSIEYITNTFIDEVSLVRLPLEYFVRLKEIVLFLNNNSSQLSLLDKQLIHSDLGPGNILYDEDDQVVGIIDFTPDIDSEFYSFSQFLYWNYLWNNSKINYTDLKKLFERYSFYSRNQISNELNMLLLIKASISRLIGKLLYQIEIDNLNHKSINKRINIVNHLMEIYFIEFSDNSK